MNENYSWELRVFALPRIVADDVITYVWSGILLATGFTKFHVLLGLKHTRIVKLRSEIMNYQLDKTIDRVKTRKTWNSSNRREKVS